MQLVRQKLKHTQLRAGNNFPDKLKYYIFKTVLITYGKEPSQMQLQKVEELVKDRIIWKHKKPRTSLLTFLLGKKIPIPNVA